MIAAAFWLLAISAAAQEWKRDLEVNGWVADFRASAETRKHLDAEHELLTRILAELGMVAR